MQIAQYKYIPSEGWQSLGGTLDSRPDFILAFGSGAECDGNILEAWRQEHFADVPLLGCSTAGEIADTRVSINTIVATAVKLERARVRLHGLDIAPGTDSRELGRALAKSCEHDGLRLFFVLSDGMLVNGTQLVKGMTDELPDSVIVTGGLAGDGKRFQETQIAINDSWGQGKIGALCFYGDDLKVGYGSLGGWDSFGPDRLVSSADANILYQLDGRSALELYREYLGEHARDLPSSGLRFPLKVTTPEGKQFVRTLLAIDSENDSMTFAGDIPVGSYARLMTANYDRLVDGAIGAAEATVARLTEPAELALLISCVGRKLVLEQRVEEELEGVRSVLGQKPAITGFYSYGEICPLDDEVGCTLHNQTMTITTLSED